MVPFSSNTSSCDPEIQNWYAQQQAAQQQAAQQQAAQQQAAQQQAAQHPPVLAPPNQVPRMVQRNPPQQGETFEEMTIDADSDEVCTAKRKRGEADGQTDTEDKPAKKNRLDPLPAADPVLRLVTRGVGDVDAPLPAKPVVPATLAALNEAIRSHDLETVKQLIDLKKIRLDDSDSENEQPLIVAVQCGFEEVVSLLVAAGADVNEYPSCYSRMNALIAAAKSGNIAMIDMLLNSGAEIDYPDSLGMTALMIAMRSGNNDVVERLIRAGANTDAEQGWRERILIDSAYYEIVDTVREMLDLGASINAVNIDDQTPLGVAAELGYDDVFECFLEAGATIHAVDKHGRTVLMFAAMSGEIKIIEKLLTLGPDLDAVDWRGRTALTIAAELGNVGAFERIQKAGASFQGPIIFGNAMLVRAAKASDGSKIKELLKQGLDIDTVDSFGETALAHVAPSAFPYMIKYLIEAGASIHAVDRNKNTVLMSAVLHGHIPLVENLLHRGADINAVNSEGKTALMICVLHRKTEILKLLLEKGAIVNLRGINSDNATLMAIKQKNSSILEQLIAHGGEPNSTKFSCTPLVYDMLTYRKLLDPKLSVNAHTLEKICAPFHDIIPMISQLQVNSGITMPAKLHQLFFAKKICHPIIDVFKQRMGDIDKLWSTIAQGKDNASAAQKLMIVAGSLASLDGWVKSCPLEWNPYSELKLTERSEANLRALVKFQVEKLAALGEQAEIKLATSLETLMPQCEKYTQVTNGALVVDEAGLITYLTEQLGLYSPLANQVAAAWSTALQGQQQRILTAIEVRHQYILDQREQLNSDDLELRLDLDALNEYYAVYWTDPLPVSIQIAFSQEDVETAVLAAFGSALKQINTVAGGTLLRSSTLQGEPAGLYADLMFRQLHMLMQYADQAGAAS